MIDVLEAAVPLQRVLHRGERVLREVLLLWHEVHPLPVPQEETEIF